MPFNKRNNSKNLEALYECLQGARVESIGLHRSQ